MRTSHRDIGHSGWRVRFGGRMIATVVSAAWAQFPGPGVEELEARDVDRAAGVVEQR